MGIKKIAVIVGLLVLAGGAWAKDCKGVFGSGDMKLSLATGSPGELGLLEALSSEFSKSANVQICWIKAGSGKSLSLLKDKKVDIAMVHAPEAEKAAIKEGWASDRTLIGSNEFYLVGPKEDSAKIDGEKSIAKAYEKVAKSESLFYTRADNSGTHKKELFIWDLAKVEPKGSWYRPNKDFMLATLLKADETKGYFMTDSSTWVVASAKIKNLKILSRGDKILINTYVALKQSGLEDEKKQKALDFINFVSSQKGQEIIRNFGKKEYGEPLYNDAVYASKYFD